MLPTPSTLVYDCPAANMRNLLFPFHIIDSRNLRYWANLIHPTSENKPKILFRGKKKIRPILDETRQGAKRLGLRRDSNAGPPASLRTQSTQSRNHTTRPRSRYQSFDTVYLKIKIYISWLYSTCCLCCSPLTLSARQQPKGGKLADPKTASLERRHLCQQDSARDAGFVGFGRTGRASLPTVCFLPHHDPTRG